MHVFVTGATGFVGSAVVQNLLAAGHQVLGMVRSNEGVLKLTGWGAQAHQGDLYNIESIKSGAATCDAVIHTAFNHDFSTFKDNCETDRQVITALASVLKGTNRPLIITSGVAVAGGIDRIITEDDKPQTAINPRIASEQAAYAAIDSGVNAYILRLPPTTHGLGDHGFVPMLADIAKQKGISAYVNNGDNHWPAVHRLDAAALYRLIAEQQPAMRVFHAVAEEGIAFKNIATAISNALKLPVESKSKEEAAAHFGWFAHFAGIDCKASSTKTRAATGWQPKHVALLEDLSSVGYFEVK